MEKTVRRCAKCGQVDEREQWDSADAAAKAGALRASWACPACAWPEADLVTAPVGRTPATAAPSAAPPGTDPVAPTDPDEARRSVETALPLRRP